ncbi:prolyl oligopeptidase family serine peptidase [Undibacterium terreum]|uniref:prolyl oligopeptidase n=1 Tax=Undibacterium terreum TaxID=1224302 RepID=A0A916XDL3_9BURK|nr:prolyl oligopeptidase family serine peptidase [Undibacterium terreum]GGC64028.1 prolyl oligopeptidase [Undibacterium terreum]
MIARRNFMLSVLALSVSRSFAANAEKSTQASLLMAREAPVVDVLWGQKIVDPYRWMEQKPDTPEFVRYLKEQGVFARQALDQIPGRQAVQHALKRYNAQKTDVSVRQVTDKYVVYIRRDPGQQLFRVYAQPVGGGEPRLLLNTEAQGGKPHRVIGLAMSPDSRHLAYSIDEGGDENRELRVLSLDSGTDVLISRLNAMPGSWLPDSSGFFYTRLRENAVRGSVDYSLGTSCWLHRIGSDPAQDTAALRSSDGPALGYGEREMPQITSATDSGWVLGAMFSNGEWPAYGLVARIGDLLQGKPGWAAVFSKEDLAVAAVVHGDDIYVLAKGKSQRGEVFKVSAKAPQAANRVVVIPQGEHVMDGLSLAKDGLYVHELRGLVGALRRYSFQSGKLEDVALPAQGAVWDVNCCPSLEGAWFGMDGLTWAAVTLHAGADLKVVDTGLTPRLPYDTSAFVTTRLDVKARDGALVPVQILHKASTKLNGRNTVLIVGYGAYGIVLDPGFQPSKLAFLENGGVLVYAHVRGGGEKGEDWHIAGQKANKPNTWRDAIDVAEALIKMRWTSQGRIALWGTSAGGIMVGRAITERPELFSVAIGEVGLFNTLRFEVTSNGPGNDEEFGTVKKEDEFRGLSEMDAYHHIRHGVKYPATLLITGANDIRVEPWQVAKMAARMQKEAALGRPVLLRVDYDSGHYSSTQESGELKSADIFAFIFQYAKG